MQTHAVTTRSLSRDQLYNLIGSAYLIIFTVISVFLGLSPILYFLFLAVAILVVTHSYSTGLKLTVIMTMIFERFFTLQPLIFENATYKLYPIDIVMLIMGIALIVYFIKTKDTGAIIWGWPEKFLFLFLILGLLNFVRSWIDPNADFSIAFSTFKNYAFYPLIYYATIAIVTTKDEFKSIIKLLMVGGGIIIFFIAWGFISGQGLWTEYTPLSTSGIRYLAGTHAFYLTIPLMIVLSLLSFKKLQHPYLAWGVIWIWIAGIIGSLMRHIWLGVGVGIFILFLAIPKQNKKILTLSVTKNILISLSIAVIIMLSVNISPSMSISDTVTSSLRSIVTRADSIINSSNDTSASWRLDLWRAAKKAWETNLLIGVGFGKAIPFESGDWRTYEEIRNIHNSPLAIAVQMGFVGLIALISFIASIVVESWKNMQAKYELTPYYAGLLASLGIFLFASLFQPYLETNLTGIFLWFLAGLLRTASVLQKTKKV